MAQIGDTQQDTGTEQASTQILTPVIGKKRKLSETSLSPWVSLVIILVGPQEHRFAVHAHVLRKVPFFRGCLDSGMKESGEGVIRMPEDLPRSVEFMIYWLYHEKLEHDLNYVAKAWTEAHEDDPRALQKDAEHNQLVKDYVSLYEFAKKMLCEDLMNLVVDNLRASWAEVRVAFGTVKVLLEHIGEEDDKLSELMMTCLAHDLNDDGSYDHWSQQNRNHFHNLLQDLNTARFVATALVRFPRQTKDPAIGEDACIWHVHIDKPACPRK